MDCLPEEPKWLGIVLSWDDGSLSKISQDMITDTPLTIKFSHSALSLEQAVEYQQSNIVPSAYTVPSNAHKVSGQTLIDPQLSTPAADMMAQNLSNPVPGADAEALATRVQQERQDKRAHFNHVCPLCKKHFSRRYIVHRHFADCVTRHGNPLGIQWYERDSIPSPRRFPCPICKVQFCSLEKTKKHFPECVELHGNPHGVEMPDKKKKRMTFKHVCPICNQRYSRLYTVRRHFPDCVRRNGNPLGLRWFDHPTASGVKLQGSVTKKQAKLFQSHGDSAHETRK